MKDMKFKTIMILFLSLFLLGGQATVFAQGQGKGAEKKEAAKSRKAEKGEAKVAVQSRKQEDQTY
jgi:hypothetical protein